MGLPSSLFVSFLDRVSGWLCLEVCDVDRIVPSTPIGKHNCGKLLDRLRVLLEVGGSGLLWPGVGSLQYHS